MIITIRDYPTSRATIKAAAPHYRKHKAIVAVTSHVTPDGGCWDGGTRYGYLIVNINTRATRSMMAPSAPVQFGGANPRDCQHELADNEIVLKMGVFCGKTATITIYSTPETLTKLGVG